MIIDPHQINSFIKHFFTSKRKGHNVHSPFAFQLCEEVFYNTNSFYDLEFLNKLRDQLLKNESSIQQYDLGAGSKTLNRNSRKIKDIAAKGISTKKQSELLYKLINLLRPNNIVELGTSLGLNTLYLALPNSNANVYTIEGNASLADHAKKLAIQNKIGNINFITGNFDQEFPRLLDKLDQLSCLYIDGNHTYEATIRYFEMALKKCNHDSIIVVDDIYWSKGMTKAWEEIKKAQNVTLTIDLFYFGMIFFRKELKEKVDLKLFI